MNRTLDDLELSMDSVSAVTNMDKQLLNRSLYDSREKHYFRSYDVPLPSAGTVRLSADLENKKYKYSRPKTISFHGTVVYESIYK